LENTVIYGLVVAAVIIAILMNWRLKINLGLVCVVFAYIIGCIIMNMKASAVVAMTPVKIVFQLAAITMFFSFPHQNGTLEALANHILYRCRKAAWSLPLALLLIGAVLGIMGAPNPMISIVIGVLGFQLYKKCHIHPLLICIAAALNGFGSNVLWTQSGTIISNTIAELGYEQSAADAIAWKYFALSAITFIIIALVFYFALRGYRAKAPENMQKPEPLTPVQVKSMIIIFVIVLLVIVSNILGSFVKTSAVTAFKGYCDIQMLCLLGSLACILLKLGDERTAITKGVPWNTIIMITGITVLLGVAQAAGVTDWLGGLVSDSVSPVLIPPFLALITGVLSFFAGGITAVFPMIAPIVPAIAAGAGLSDSTLFCCTAIGGNLTTISPFSTGGATILSVAPEEEQVLLFRGQLLVALVGLGISMLLAFVGFYGIIPA